jgi:vacuolar-type H+-ATPase subunit H
LKKLNTIDENNINSTIEKAKKEINEAIKTATQEITEAIKTANQDIDNAIETAINKHNTEKDTEPPQGKNTTKTQTGKIRMGWA